LKSTKLITRQQGSKKHLKPHQNLKNDVASGLVTVSINDVASGLVTVSINDVASGLVCN
jgi:hypothetical protein